MNMMTIAAMKERLTPRQYEILGLVAQQFSSKEIGIKLNLSPKTVDIHVKEITLRVGVATRTEAARMFRQASDEYRERTLREPAELVTPPISPPSIAQPEGKSPPAEIEEPAHETGMGLRFLLRRLFTLPPVGGPEHDMTSLQRWMMIGQISLASMIMFAVTVWLIVGVVRLFAK